MPIKYILPIQIIVVLLQSISEGNQRGVILVLARENVGNFHRICRDSVAVRVYSVGCFIQFRIFKVFPTTVTRGVVYQYHALLFGAC